MTDHLRPPAGRFDMFNRDGVIRYRNEADLRDAIASRAWLDGWTVATEVPVANGGRADIVLTFPNTPTIVIECKVNLRTIGQFRKGFQQVDGYRRFFDHDYPCIAFLTAANFDILAGEPLIYHYMQVLPASLRPVMERVRLAHSATLAERTAVARRRNRNAARVLDTSNAETASMALALRKHHIERLFPQYEGLASTLFGALSAEGRAA